MKKGLLFVAVLSAFSFASCKKDHTCTCQSDTPGSTANVVTYTKCKKGDARAACLSSKSTYSGVTVTTTCTIN